MLNTHTMNDNKLISEFMGITGEYNEDEKVVYLDSDIDGKGIYAFSDMKYHTEWNWLMPVVDKIESMRGVFRRGGMTKGGQQHNATETKYVIEYGMHDKVIAHVYATTRIEAEYQAVVEFIKAKNNQDAEKNKLI